MAVPENLGWDDEHVIEAARSLQELVLSPGFTMLRRVAQTRADQLVDRLTMMGPDSNSAPYADLVGELRGVRSVIELAEGVILRGEQLIAELRSTAEVAA